MPELNSLVSFVDATPLELLRRSQLWMVAEAHGISYPTDATKDTMVSILKGMGIDVTKPVDGIQWEVVRGMDERGRPSQFVAPVRQPGQSDRTPGGSEMMLQERLAELTKEKGDTEDKNEAQAKVIAEQREQIANLTSLIQRMEQKLDQYVAPNGVAGTATESRAADHSPHGASELSDSRTPGTAGAESSRAEDTRSHTPDRLHASSLQEAGHDASGDDPAYTSRGTEDSSDHSVGAHAHNQSNTVLEPNSASSPRGTLYHTNKRGAALAYFRELRAEAKELGLDVPMGTKLPALQDMVEQARGQDTP